MARKVFISFLGTTNYTPCTYKIDEKALTTEPVRFVQESLIWHFCMKPKAQWTENDVILIFCTKYSEINKKKGAFELNWVDNGHGERAKTDLERQGLKSRLAKLQAEGLKPKIKMIPIASGFTEEQIWTIFDTVYEQIEEGDHIYFDVTHAFRSIPIFSIVLFNHAKVLKGSELKAIKYGAFEAPDTNGLVPILDLTNIARLQEYNQIASSLVEFGKIKKLSENINQRDDAESDDIIYNLGLSINYLDEYMSTIQLENLKPGEYIGYFRDSMKSLTDKNVPSPIIRILERLQQETESFVDEYDNKNIEAAIEWAYQHEMLIQEYSLAEEYIIHRVIQIVDEEELDDLEYKDQRELISSLLSMPWDKFKKNNFDRGVPQKYPELTKRIKDNNRALLSELRESQYGDLRIRRNSLAHAYGEFDYETLRNGFYDLYSSCKQIIDSHID